MGDSLVPAVHCQNQTTQGKMNQALKLAIKVIDKEIKNVNIQANLYEIYKMKAGKSAWEYRNKLMKARKEINDLRD